MEIAAETLKFEKFLKASEILKSISNPYRLEILEILEDEEYHPVFEIQKTLNIEPSLLSHHLNKMKDKGIISSYKEGRFIHYKLALKEIMKVLDCINECEF